MRFDFSAIEPLDFAITQAIQSIASKPLDFAFSIITLIGNPAIWILVAAIILWKGKERDSFFLMNLIVFSTAIVAFSKAFFERLRPSSEKFLVAKDLIPQIESDGLNGIDYSFPSGHASMISAAFFYFKKISKNRKIFLAILVPLVFLSRIYLGKHFISDVLAGLLVGFLVGNANYFLKKLVEKKELKLTKLEEEVGFIAALAASFIAITFINAPKLALTVLGYYAGFFLLKELNIDSTAVAGKKFYAKAFIGMAGLGAILAPAILLKIPETIELAAFFLSGFWISFIWPFLFEKFAKKP